LEHIRATSVASLPPARAITLKGIAIYRVESGKLMERWVVSDLYGLLEEIRESSPY
jgi:hypothetical protein